MNGQNGRVPGVPITLTGPQRAAALAHVGLTAGWLLLSVSEMFEMQKAMQGATDENERLNKQTARLVSRGIVNAAVTDKVLASARAFLAIVAERDADPAIRVDALNEIAHIDEALALLPTVKNETREKEGDPKP